MNLPLEAKQNSAESACSTLRCEINLPRAHPTAPAWSTLSTDPRIAKELGYTNAYTAPQRVTKARSKRVTRGRPDLEVDLAHEILHTSDWHDRFTRGSMGHPFHTNRHSIPFHLGSVLVNNSLWGGVPYLFPSLRSVEVCVRSSGQSLDRLRSDRAEGSCEIKQNSYP